VTVRAATLAPYFLGEGPVWDADRQRLLWVDIHAGHVLIGELHQNGTITESGRLRLPGAAAAAAFSESGTFLVALDGRIVTVSDVGVLADVAHVLPPGRIGRLNDGKVDPQGRFVVGSHSGGTGSTTEILALVDGSEVTVIDDDLTLSNGLGWSGDGSVFYSVDTFSRVIHRRPWSAAGPAGAREDFITVEHGYPDGMTVDSEDHLWVAVWGGARVDRYAPDGRRVSSIDIPAPHVSSVTFAGPDLRTLVITTALEDLTEEQRAAFPDAGRLFTIDLDVPGVPQRPWAATTAHERKS
jgi:sugar lactone lactonase YvrE